MNGSQYFQWTICRDLKSLQNGSLQTSIGPFFTEKSRKNPKIVYFATRDENPLFFAREQLPHEPRQRRVGQLFSSEKKGISSRVGNAIFSTRLQFIKYECQIRKHKILIIFGINVENTIIIIIINRRSRRIVIRSADFCGAC